MQYEFIARVYVCVVCICVYVSVCECMRVMQLRRVRCDVLKGNRQVGFWTENLSVLPVEEENLLSGAGNFFPLQCTITF